MSHQIQVCFLPTEINAADLSDRSAVVIDVLRASTTICHALNNGARDVIPTETPTKAQELRASIGRDAVLLCGERKGIIIDGFDLGNSPQEYINGTVNNKTLLYCSSNGSAALLASQHAGRMAMAGLVNARAVLDWLRRSDTDVLLVCAGKLGAFSAEDAACAGFFAIQLVESGFEIGNDAARVAVHWAEQAKDDWPRFLKSTDHGRYLTDLGFESDLDVAARIDSVGLVPEWQGTRLACPTSTVKA